MVFRFLGWGLLALLALFTLRQSQVWTSEEALWTRAVEQSPQSPRPHLNLGIEYQKQGKRERALAQFRLAAHLAHDPNRKLSHQRASWASAESNIAVIYLLQGKTAESFNVSTRVLSEMPNWSQAHINRGTAFLLMGRCKEAALDYFLAGIKDLPNCKGDS